MYVPKKINLFITETLKAINELLSPGKLFVLIVQLITIQNIPLAPLLCPILLGGVMIEIEGSSTE